MSNYNSLKTTINANIKQNGRQEITGQILNSVLNQMVTTLGAGYQFAGVATTATNPESPDAKVFYIANGKGTYTNFGGIEVTEDEVVVLYWDSSWHKVSTGIASQANLTELETKNSQLGQEVYDLNDAVDIQADDEPISQSEEAFITGYADNDGKYYGVGGAVVYGFYYIPVLAGKTYRVAGKYGGSASYAGVVFDTQLPQNGNYATAVIDLYDVENESYDVTYTAPSNGYLYVWDGNKTGTHAFFLKKAYSGAIKKLSDTTIAAITETKEEMFVKLCTISKKMAFSDVLESSEQILSDANGAYYYDGKITLGPAASYGIRYIPVSVGDIVKVKTDIGYVINEGFPNVIFVEQMQSNRKGVILGYIADSHVSEKQERDYYFIAPNDGVVGISYFNNQSDKYHIYLYSGDLKPFLTDEDGRDKFLMKDSDLTFPNIETAYFPDGTSGTAFGERYAASDMLEVTGFKSLTGKLRGNGNIASVLFLDASKQAITSLSIANYGFLNINVDLTDAAYASVKYIVCSIFRDDAEQPFDSYATLKSGVADDSQIQEELENYSLKVCKYKKYRAIGDSLTNASPWINIVKDTLKIETVVRAGASGLTMADLDGEDSIHEAIMALTADNDIDLISVWAGTNDFAFNIPLGDFETQYAASTRDTTTFYGSYMDSIEHLLATFPKARLFLIGTTDRVWRAANSGKPWNDAMTDTYGGAFLPNYVEAVKKLAERYGLPFLDLLHTSGINKHNIDQYMFLQTSGSDEYYLHFNDGFGTTQIGQRIAAFINSIG